MLNTTKLGKFLNDPASETQPVRRHRLEDIHISYTANGAVQGVHVEIWDETAQRLPDGRFAEAVDRHNQIVRPAELADLIELLPDHADLLAQISAREAERVTACEAAAAEAERANAAEAEVARLTDAVGAQSERLEDLGLEVRSLTADRTDLRRNLQRAEGNVKDLLARFKMALDMLVDLGVSPEALAKAGILEPIEEGATMAAAKGGGAGGGGNHPDC